MSDQSLNPKYQALITAAIGRSVQVTATADNQPSGIFNVARIDDAKTGKLKDGSKGSYLILTNADDAAVVINLHPSSADRLLKKGEDGHMKLIEQAPAASSETAIVDAMVAAANAANVTSPASSEAAVVDGAANAANAANVAPAVKVDKRAERSKAAAEKRDQAAAEKLAAKTKREADRAAAAAVKLKEKEDRKAAHANRDTKKKAAIAIYDQEVAKRSELLKDAVKNGTNIDDVPTLRSLALVRFKAELNMSEDGASTYFQTCNSLANKKTTPAA